MFLQTVLEPNKILGTFPHPTLPLVPPTATLKHADPPLAGIIFSPVDDRPAVADAGRDVPKDPLLALNLSDLFLSFGGTTWTPTLPFCPLHDPNPIRSAELSL